MLYLYFVGFLVGCVAVAVAWKLEWMAHWQKRYAIPLSILGVAVFTVVPMLAFAGLWMLSMAADIIVIVAAVTYLNQVKARRNAMPKDDSRPPNQPRPQTK